MMIRVTVRRNNTAGTFSLHVEGHGPGHVCMAVTAAEQALLLWFEQFADQLPDQLTLDFQETS
jgi:uncharacterized protein YsxB (DUF464 family)